MWRETRTDNRNAIACVYIAVYLSKRALQNRSRYELADYEAESLSRLQKLLSRKWEFVYTQAEMHAK